jgi:5-(carboxyamino)imidazole ribonucleotide synthase
MITAATPSAQVQAAPYAARVGMAGAGQLARMTFQAAADLDVRMQVLAGTADDAAVRAGAPYRLGPPDDLAALRTIARSADVLTLDHEHVPIQVLERLVADGHVVRPGPRAVRLAADKLHARRDLQAAGFPVPRFAEVHDVAGVAALAERTGWPVVVKARGGGYDGRGVHVVRDVHEAAAVLAAGGAWLAEEHVDLGSEVSVLLARRPGGETAVYPLAETTQVDGICRELTLPALLDPQLELDARELGIAIAEHAGVCGVAAIELFVTTGGGLLVGELAVRPHNSGHATIEACRTSQFHNHLRGILDWPLGDPGLRVPAAAMVNVLGAGDGRTTSRLPRALAVPGAAVHLYGKAERAGRKLGHVTATGPDPQAALQIARAAASELQGA